MKIINRQLLENKIIDIHTHSVGVDLNHLRTGKYPVTQNIFDLSKIIACNGVDYAVTFPMPTTIYYNTNLIREKGLFEPSGFSDYPYQYENYSLCKMISQLHLTNLIPFLSVSAQSKITEQIDGILKLNEEFGIYGIKYHTTTERLDINAPQFAPFALLAQDLNIPIMIHSAVSSIAHPNNVLKFARQYPLVRVCIAHCARFCRDTLEKIKDDGLKNVFVDTAPFIRLCSMALNSKDTLEDGLQFNFNYPRIALRKFMEYIPTQVLWGTDIPWQNFMDESGHLITYEDEVAILNDLSEVFIKTVMDNQLNYLFGF